MSLAKARLPPSTPRRFTRFPEPRMPQLPERIRDALSRAAVRQEQRNNSPPRTTRENLQDWARSHLRD